MGYHHYFICSFIIPPHLRTGKKICVIRHAPGKGSCYVVAVAGEEVYVLTVDKAGFDEDGGHSGVAQDAEGGMGFDAAVLVTCVKGGEAFYQLVLDAGRLLAASTFIMVTDILYTVSFRRTMIGYVYRVAMSKLAIFAIILWG